MKNKAIISLTDKPAKINREWSKLRIYVYTDDMSHPKKIKHESSQK